MKFLTELAARLAQPFYSKADIKRFKDELARESGINNANRAMLPAMREAAEGSAEHEAITDDYWAMPSELHRVKPAHIEMLAKYDAELAEKIAEAIELYKATKSIVLSDRESADKIDQAIRNEIRSSMAHQKAEFIRKLDLSKKFGLRVYANAHLVCGETCDYIRVFYYLNGELTSLGKIIAIAEIVDPAA